MEDPKVGRAKADACFDRVEATVKAPKVLEAFLQEFEAVRGLF